MIYNNNNVVQNIYERSATGRRTEGSPLRALNRDRDCCVEKSTNPFNCSNKIPKCKLIEGNIESLSNSGQTIMDVL